MTELIVSNASFPSKVELSKLQPGDFFLDPYGDLACIPINDFGKESSISIPVMYLTVWGERKLLLTSISNFVLVTKVDKVQISF